MERENQAKVFWEAPARCADAAFVSDISAAQGAQHARTMPYLEAPARAGVVAVIFISCRILPVIALASRALFKTKFGPFRTQDLSRTVFRCQTTSRNILCARRHGKSDTREGTVCLRGLGKTSAPRTGCSSRAASRIGRGITSPGFSCHTCPR